MLPGPVVRGSKNPLHFGLASRLKALLKTADMPMLQLAERAGLYTSHVAYILDSSRAPRVDTVEKLARALGVSPCWLAFGQEGPLSETDTLCSAELSTRLADARTQAGLSRKELGRLSATSDTTVRQAETREICPNLATVERLAVTLSVSPCWLAYGVGIRDAVQHRPSDRS